MSYYRNYWIRWGYVQRASGATTTAYLEHIKNIFAHNSTYKYVACPAWKLEARLAADDFHSVSFFRPVAIQMELGTFQVYATESMWHSPVPRQVTVKAWLRLKDACTVWLFPVILQPLRWSLWQKSLAFPQWINELSQIFLLCLENMLKRQKISQEWWKSSTTWQQGSIFSKAHRFGFVRHNK